LTVPAQTSSRSARVGRLRGALPEDLAIIRLFLVALAAILVGYMAMGRGFAHIGVGPVFIGDAVLALGILAGVVAAVRHRLDVRPTLILALLLTFMVLGALRTIPYVGKYGIDALRDGVLWGYGIFAVLVYGLVNRGWIEAAVRLYGRVVPLFALWLPFCWIIFRELEQGIDPTRPGSNHPLVFFKAGDMAVHAAGAIAFLVIAPTAAWTIRALFTRVLVAIPLVWALFLSSAASRGALLGAAAGVGTALLGTRRLSNWIPLVTAALVVVVSLNVRLPLGGAASPSPSPQPSSTLSAGATATPVPVQTPFGGRTPAPTEAGRSVSVGQIIQNVGSILGPTSDSNLDGTRAFRLAWWTKIADYTIFGPYFWTGKGFGVNLADDDGFQPTADHSLRAPHNSHMTVLARMGVPGAVLWILLQGAFVMGLLRAIWVHRREGEQLLAGVGLWILVIWAAMMVNTSFDPYLEGPQGGIWFWSAFGLGLVVMRLVPKRAQS